SPSTSAEIMSKGITPSSRLIYATTPTFAQVVKWCLKAQKNDLLPHDSYEIRGGDLKGDPPNVVAVFEIEREQVLETSDDLL
ncbi:MAG: hypothetical protein VB138_09415, partial [Burkholderia sp.]